MSAFDDAFDALCNPALFAQFGEPVTYTDTDGTATAIEYAEVTYEERENVESPAGESMVERARVVVAASDIAAPVRDATVTIGSVVWTIDYVRPLTGKTFELHIKRANVSRRHAQNYRRRL